MVASAYALSLTLWLPPAPGLLCSFRGEILNFASVYVENDLTTPGIGIFDDDLCGVAILDLLTG